jgi:hypothetical protein
MLVYPTCGMRERVFAGMGESRGMGWDPNGIDDGDRGVIFVAVLWLQRCGQEGYGLLVFGLLEKNWLLL